MSQAEGRAGEWAEHNAQLRRIAELTARIDLEEVAWWGLELAEKALAGTTVPEELEELEDDLEKARLVLAGDTPEAERWWRQPGYSPYGRSDAWARYARRDNARPLDTRNAFRLIVLVRSTRALVRWSTEPPPDDPVAGVVMAAFDLFQTIWQLDTPMREILAAGEQRLLENLETL